jgi:hypothetical protein
MRSHFARLICPARRQHLVTHFTASGPLSHLRCVHWNRGALYDRCMHSTSPANAIIRAIVLLLSLGVAAMD